MAKGHAKRAWNAPRQIGVQIMLDPPMHKRLTALAKRERRSLRNLITFAAENLARRDGLASALLKNTSPIVLKDHVSE